MSEMTLPSKHRIRNSNPGGMRSRRLPTILSFLRVDAEETCFFVSFDPPTLGPPPIPGTIIMLSWPFRRYRNCANRPNLI